MKQAEACPNKLEGHYNGIPIYSNPLVPEGIIYFVNESMIFKYPTRKDGKPDMRYNINKLQRAFEECCGAHKSTRGIV